VCVISGSNFRTKYWLWEQNILSNDLPNDSLDPFARPAGSEPGVDATQAWVHELYSHIHDNCSIQVVDYSSANVNIQRMDNHSFLRFLEQSPRQHPGDVRWIDITVSTVLELMQYTVSCANTRACPGMS
jgi:hypothetical protein